MSRIEAHVANVIVLREPRALPTAERVVQDLVAEIRLGDPRRVDERFLDDAIDLHARQVASTARALWRARIDGARTDRRGETSPLHAEGTRQLVRSEIENSSDLFLKRVAPNLPPTGERDVLVTFHLRGEAVSDLLKRRADLRIFLWLRDTGGRYQVAGYAEEATP